MRRDLMGRRSFARRDRWLRSVGGSMGTSLGGTSMGMGMASSPFGRSVDMVDVVTQLMDAGGASLAKPSHPNPLGCCGIGCSRGLHVRPADAARTRHSAPPASRFSGFPSTICRAVNTPWALV